MESAIESKFKIQLKAYQIDFEQEVKLIPDRRFSFDFVLKSTPVAIEIQGGTWSKGKSGHNSGSGIRRDCEKSNLAQMYGYTIFKFTSDMVISGEAIAFLCEYLNKWQLPNKSGSCQAGLKLCAT